MERFCFFDTVREVYLEVLLYWIALNEKCFVHLIYINHNSEMAFYKYEDQCEWTTYKDTSFKLLILAKSIVSMTSGGIY